MGTTFDSCSNKCDAELGNGNKEMVPCIQNTYLLWNVKGEEAEKTGMQ